MNTTRKIVSQSFPYELRIARDTANAVAAQALVVYQGYIKPPFLGELSVKESCAVEWENEDGDIEARTTFTFRYEGGTSVRIQMKGHDDCSYGFQWQVEAAFLTLYMDTEAAVGAQKEHVWLWDYQRIQKFLNVGHRKDAQRTEEHYIRRSPQVAPWQDNQKQSIRILEVPAYEWEQPDVFDFVFAYDVDKEGKWTPYIYSMKVRVPGTLVLS